MKKLKLVSFVIFCISLAASLIFWFTQVRKGDRIGPVITMDQQELTVGLNATDEDFLQGVKAVDENLGNYRIPEAARALEEFVDDMSNWYVRRSRERFWAKGMEQDKINAYMTLYTALVTVAKAAAPMIPFMTEDIYQNLVRSLDKTAPESIHLCDFPEVKEEWINKDLEENMEEVLDVVVLGRACRNTANIKNRQPIGTMYVKAPKVMDKYFTFPQKKWEKTLAIAGKMWYSPLRQLNRDSRACPRRCPTPLFLACRQGRGKEKGESYEETNSRGTAGSILCNGIDGVWR